MDERRLLVVDDEPGFCEFVRTVASGLGYVVDVATSAAAFKEAYSAHKPTVIVLDVVMPDTDGIELINWLVDCKCTAHLVVVTGFTPKYAELAGKLGEAKGMRSVSILTKSVKVATLRDALAPDNGG